MYSTSDLKRGVILELEGAPHLVEVVQTSSPTARGASTIHKVKLRNLKTRQRVERSFRGGETFAVPDVEYRSVDFLYDEPGAVHFMDKESFEQFAIDRADLEWESRFLHEGIEAVRVIYFNEAPLAIELPNVVSLEITETTPPVKGNSGSGLTKEATLSTGYVVKVPEQLEQGTVVQIDTRTGEFLGRAKG